MYSAPIYRRNKELVTGVGQSLINFENINVCMKEFWLDEENQDEY